MSRHRKDPLRRPTADERQEWARLSRSLSAAAAQSSAPEPCWPLRMARATRRRPTGSDDGTPRPFQPGSAASTATGSRPCGRATEVAHGIRYGADAQQRILAEWARTPQRNQDGTATWSLSLLQRALRQADDGLRSPGERFGVGPA